MEFFKRMDKIVLALIMVGLVMCGSAHATIFLYYDAENEDIGENVPYSTDIRYDPELCEYPQCSSTVSTRGFVHNNGGAPQGNKYFNWLTVQDQKNSSTQVKNKLTLPFPIDLTLGKTYYLAYFMRFDRINGLDIWHEGSMQSADKGVELRGSGIRFTTSRGQWTECNSKSASFPHNDDHHFTIWVGNPTFHINPELEEYGANLEGYHCGDLYQRNGVTPQLTYETWYSVVMGLKLATDNTGSIQLWLDGTKILEYTDIQTSENNTPSLLYVEMNGTIAQGTTGPDAPPHYRKFDAMMVTDSWQDIIDGGYLAESTTPVDTTPPPEESPPSSMSTVRNFILSSASSPVEEIPTIQNPLLLYDFHTGSGNTVYDISNVGSAMNLMIDDLNNVTWLNGGGLSITQPALISAAVDSKVATACMASNEISIEAWIKPANTSQTGPARIVSFSKDGSYRNFTLGQTISAYDVRLRTTVTGNNGSSPSTRTGDGVVETTVSHIVYTRNAAGTAKIYKNGIEVISTAIGGDLSNWDSSYSFALANELSADRPWLGEFHRVAVYGRALTAEEITSNFVTGF